MQFECTHCGRVFSRRTALRNHIKTHDSVIDRILEGTVGESNQQASEEEVINDQREEELVNAEYLEEEMINANEELINPDEEMINTEELNEELINVDEERLEERLEEELEKELEEELEEEMINATDQVRFNLLQLP